MTARKPMTPCGICGRLVGAVNVGRHEASHANADEARRKRLARFFNLCACGARKVRKAPMCRACRWAQPRVLAPLADRFWPKVDRSGGAGACWPWKGATTRRGVYGQFNDSYAHRIAYELTYGPIPAGLWALHKCDYKPCCNPSHIYAGTPRDNSLDAVARGQWKQPPNPWVTHPERMNQRVWRRRIAA